MPGAQRTLEAYSRGWPWRRRVAIEPRRAVSCRVLEREMPQGPLGEVFHARGRGCKDMIQMRQVEGRPGEREHLMHEFERQKYFMKAIVYTKIDRYEKLEFANGSNLAVDGNGFLHAVGFGKRRIDRLGK